MAAPTFVAEYETAWNSTTTPKTTAAFDVLEGDLLVAVCVLADVTLAAIAKPTGGSLYWDQKSLFAAANFTSVGIWTARVDADQNMTVTFARSGASAQFFGGNVFHFRDAQVGSSPNPPRNVTGAAPQYNIQIGKANSAIVVVIGDWAAASTARNWLTSAGSLTEQTYWHENGQYTVYAGIHKDAGTVAALNVGLSIPAVQTYTIEALEIAGSTTLSAYDYKMAARLSG